MNLKKIKPIHLFWILILILAAFLRFYNLNWDEGNYFHPDERNIDMAVSRISFFDKLDPQFFAYGGLPIYLYRASGELLIQITRDQSWTSDWNKINLIGRFYSALFSLVTIVVIFLLAKKLFGHKTALLSAVFFAFTVSSIQTAHFGITESFITLCITLITLLSVNFLQYPTSKRFISIGGVLSLALAAKTTSISFLIVPILSWLIIAVRDRSHILAKIMTMLIFLLVIVFIFTLFSPYTFLSWNKFMESMHYEQGVVTGTLSVPYTLQFTATISYLYQLKNLFWQMGPLALIVIPGIIFLMYSVVKKKDFRLLLFLSFPLIYFAYVGLWHTKFIRYMVPLLPFLVIAASALLGKISNRFKFVGVFITGFFIVITVLWALAFFSIYLRPQTRISASLWMYQNIPARSVVTGEHWDDGLPVAVGKYTPDLYHRYQLTIYDADNAKKLTYYSTELSKADYLVLNSRRLYGTLMNLPDKYPLTGRYYQLLFEEKLGFQKVAEFTSYPSLFGFQINDDSSEETFQVLDHPKVMIYKNVNHFNPQAISNLLSSN